STRDELTRALGPALEDLQRAHDPHIVVPSTLRSSRMILDGDRVVAIVLVAPEAASPHASSDCARPASQGNRFGTCLGSGELVEGGGEEMVVRTPDGEKQVTWWRWPNLVFAAPLRIDTRDELIAVARTDDANVRPWSLVAFSLDKNKPVRTIEPKTLYQLS